MLRSKFLNFIKNKKLASFSGERAVFVSYSLILLNLQLAASFLFNLNRGTYPMNFGGGTNHNNPRTTKRKGLTTLHKGNAAGTVCVNVVREFHGYLVTMKNG